MTPHLESPVECEWCGKREVPPRYRRRVPFGWFRLWRDNLDAKIRPLVCDECLHDVQAVAE